MARFFFFCSFAVLIAIGAFVFGIQSANDRNAAYRLLRDVKDSVAAVRRELTEDSATAYTQSAPGADDGVVVNTNERNDSLVFLSGFMDGASALRLIARDGTVIANWPVSYDVIFPDSGRDPGPEPDVHGALVEQDGSVVFNFEYAGMVKLDRCGEVVWTLKHPTHHSVETARAGGYWVVGRTRHRDNLDNKFPPFTETSSRRGYDDDQILHVSGDGEILLQRSIAEILYDAGLEALLTANGERFDYGAEWWDRELVHVNKIGELSDRLAVAFPMFAPGDLLLSFRTYNLIMVIDPEDWAVKWHQTGPWLRQHDPEFTEDGVITVFNNNGYANSTRFSRPERPLRSNILSVDPETGATEVVYGAGDVQLMKSTFRGKQDPTMQGGILVTESEGGRVFEVDADGGIVWDYVNRLDENRLGEINEARVYLKSYFEPLDFSCQ